MHTVSSHASFITVSWWTEVAQKIWNEGVFLKAFQDKLKEDRDFWQGIYSTVSMLLEQVSEIKWKDLWKSMKDKAIKGLSAFWSEFTSGLREAGYYVGIAVFEALLTFFTAGSTQYRKLSEWTTFGLNKLKNWKSPAAIESVVNTAIHGAKTARQFACRILLGGCFVKDTPVLMAHIPFRNVVPAVALAGMPLVAPIQDVQVDDMVKAYLHVEVEYRDPDLVMSSIGEDMYLTASNDVEDPGRSVGNDIYVPRWQDYDYLDITPETWHVGKFIITEEDGSLVEIEANRPKRWFEENQLFEKGDYAFLFMPDLGVAGNAELISIRPTSVDTRILSLNESGQVERPVITTFKRHASVVSDYYFSDGGKVSCTPNHPFFSIDRQGYVPIGELSFGETVQTAGERAVKFIGGKTRQKGESVYNIEVWREHNYYVGIGGGEDFVLVHNACWRQVIDFLNDPKRNDILADWWKAHFPRIFERGNFFEQVMRQKKFKDWKYTGKGFDQNGIKIQGDGISNYKAIDFYKDDVVASMKSTKYADPSDWLNANYPNVGQKNKQHIEDLLDGLQDGRFPQYTGQPIENIKLKNINKAELHVYRPDMNGFSENDWINAIKNYAQSIGYSNDVINKLKVNVSRMEDHL